MKGAELPSRVTFRVLASLTSDLGKYTLTYPLVPEVPLTLKPSSWLVELKKSEVTVEFEVTEKTLCSCRGKTAKLTIL